MRGDPRGFSIVKAMKLRTFLGISLADALRANLDLWTRAMEPNLNGVRWVPAAQMHVTLQFLGEIDAEVLGLIEQRAQAIAQQIPPSRLEVGGVGIFKSLRHPRILWAGIQGDGQTLTRLHRELSEALRDLPVDQQALRQKFFPHITIARVRKNQRPRGLEHFLKLGNDKHFGEFPLEAVTLFKSELTREGARYSTITRFELGG